MKLIYISNANLRDRLFIKDLVNNFKFAEKALMIHDTFGDTVEDTRFVTKRISSLLSECMVYNNAFSADQRNLIRVDQGQMVVNTPLIERLLPPIQLLIIGPVIRNGSHFQLADPLAMVAATRSALDIDESLLFTDNPMSPLAAKKPVVGNEGDRDHLLGIYEEESAAIHRAFHMRPAKIVSPVNYSQ